MKFLLIALFLVGCGAAPKSGSQTFGDTSPSPITNPPRLVGSPTPIPSPTTTPVSTPIPTPTPAPTPLAHLTCGGTCNVAPGCQVSCTGGNIGLNVRNLDLDGMFGGPPNWRIISMTVTNDNFAADWSITTCTQQSQHECYLHSVCVAVVLMENTAGNPLFNTMKCGDAFDENTDWLKEI